MKKTLIILAHPDLTRSMANKKLKEEAEKNTDIIVHDIYKEYPKIRAEDLNTNTTNRFIDVALPNKALLVWN